MKRRDFLSAAALSAAFTGGLSVSFGEDAAEAPVPASNAIFAGRTGSPKPGWGDGPAEHMTA